MFVQLVRGRVADTAGVRRQVHHWHAKLAAGAAGWRGTTGGVTGDGRLALVVRFDTAESARANAARPEQDAWWAQTAACLDGPADFHETTDVSVVHERDPAAARFVQLMVADVAERARFEEVEARIGPGFLAARPDVLAAYRLWFGDRRVVAVDHFRTEAEARAGERAAMPDDVTTGFGEWMSLLSNHEWLDLTDPWITVP